MTHLHAFHWFSHTLFDVYLIIETEALLYMVALIISLHNFGGCPQYIYIVRDLCYFRDCVNPFVLTRTEIVQLIEYLSTIYISKLISLGDVIYFLYYKPVYYYVCSCVFNGTYITV